MIIKFLEVKELFDEYDQVTTKAQNIAIFARDLQLQKREVETLSNFINKAKVLKSSNKQKYSEEELNLVLFMIFCVDAVRSELEMLVNLKENRMDLAWVALVHSQLQISVAVQNHPFDHRHLDGFVDRIHSYEKLLFPEMLFSSPGYLIKLTRCNICGLEYEECDHLKGKFYAGELCVREIHEAQLEEISLVKNPASKLCRVMSDVIDGKTIDILTLVEMTDKE